MYMAARTTIFATSIILGRYETGCCNGTVMVAIIDGFDPTSPAESADLFSMRQFASDMRNVIEAACAIEQRRWESLKA